MRNDLAVWQLSGANLDTARCLVMASLAVMLWADDKFGFMFRPKTNRRC